MICQLQKNRRQFATTIPALNIPARVRRPSARPAMASSAADTRSRDFRHRLMGPQPTLISCAGMRMGPAGKKWTGSYGFGILARVRIRLRRLGVVVHAAIDVARFLVHQPGYELRTVPWPGPVRIVLRRQSAEYVPFANMLPAAPQQTRPCWTYS